MALATTVFHAPCAFNPLGATRDACERMTRTMWRNLEGCSARDCTCKLRICRICVTKGLGERAKDPKTGLCETHSHTAAAGTYIHSPTLPHTVAETLPGDVTSKKEIVAHCPQVTSSPLRRAKYKPKVETAKLPPRLTRQERVQEIKKVNPPLPVEKNKSKKSQPKYLRPKVAEDIMQRVVSGFNSDVTALAKLVDDLVTEREILLDLDRASLTQEMLHKVLDQNTVLNLAIHKLTRELARRSS